MVTKEQADEFEKLARPLIKWLCENQHPHTHIIIESTHAELSEGLCVCVTSEYVRD